MTSCQHDTEVHAVALQAGDDLSMLCKPGRQARKLRGSPVAQLHAGRGSNCNCMPALLHQRTTAYAFVQQHARQYQLKHENRRPSHPTTGCMAPVCGSGDSMVCNSALMQMVPVCHTEHSVFNVQTCSMSVATTAHQLAAAASTVHCGANCPWQSMGVWAPSHNHTSFMQHNWL